MRTEKQINSLKLLHARNVGKHIGKKLSRETRTCECGCNETFECKITSKKRFLVNHSQRGRKRSFSEEHIKKFSLAKLGKPNMYCKGEKSHFWKGGITPLAGLIRNLIECKIWKQSVFKRDNYTCQKCNKRGSGIIEAHHIKPFALIFQEFLQKYNQFSPIDDKETLVRLASNYIDFWDISNGETLCEYCHKLTDSYSNKNNKEMKQF